MRDQNIKKEIESLEVFKVLAQSFQEIASQRMKKIRLNVLSSREYMDDIYKIFNTVRAAYRKELEKLSRKRGSSITFLPHNGKKVSVFLSSQTGLYGGIMRDTLDQLLEDQKSNNSEVTVIGSYGAKLFASAEPNTPYSFFDFPEEDDEKSLMFEIIKHIVQYESVKIFYPRFENIVIQKPSELSVSANLDSTTVQQSDKELTPYIFEPSLEKILMFFEKEIFASIIQQAVKENELARSASRVMAMDRSTQNSQREIAKLNLKLLRSKHNRINKNQLQRISAVFYVNA